MSAISPCPFCGDTIEQICKIDDGDIVTPLFMFWVECEIGCSYSSIKMASEWQAIAAHNALCARLAAAKAMAEALEPLAREADNWLPGAPDNKWIGHSKVIGSVLSEYIPITVGHARAAQRALAAWKAAQNSQPAPGAETNNDPR